MVGVEPDVPAELHTDEQRLRRCCGNLLSNAVKFTASGRVELRTRRADPAELPAAADRPFVAFSVLDTGVGIAEENLDTIFNAFQQADGTTSRRYGGTGLGLSIGRQIAALLGGEIRAVSEADRGVRSRFTCRWTASTARTTPSPCCRWSLCSLGGLAYLSWNRREQAAFGAGAQCGER